MLGEIFDNVTVSPDFCRSMDIIPGPSRHPPARVGGRVLFIQGTLDDRTPLGNVDELATSFSEATIVTVENGGHELLPAPDVQGILIDFFTGKRLSSSTIRWPAPRFMTVEQALEPPRRPGGG